MNRKKENKQTLNDAPKSVQLAVDLIQLLEENGVENQIAADALGIVLNDFKRKITEQKD